ncbi:hypothetical protein [Nitrosopumilus sp.]|uniref:hypothetical protein n=1 Tax=Nitrosopumilus sp. TaxID=2024843 RepID=UPI00292F9ABB|nr:hypothetical protein [Nitrosopumilus sp.]
MQNQTIHYNINWKRLAVAIPVVAVIHMFLLYGLFMNPISQDIIFSENMGQSDKLVAVWNTLEPIPSEMSLTPALIITPMIFSFLFAVLYQSIPGNGILRKGFFFGVMWWGTVAVFFELFTPLGLFGEPLHLLVYELFLWFVGLITVGIILGVIYSSRSVSE